MSAVQVTPRKRKVGITDHGLMTPPSSGRTRHKKAPAPNPPLAPFPTPPSTTKRRSRISEPSYLDDELDSDTQSFPSGSTSQPLPEHLQTLLSLHHAFNLALSLHIATKPPILPPHPPSTVRLQLPCLTNYLAIRETVERTARKRFGPQDLARLAWLWEWDGESMSEDGDLSGSKEGGEDDNPFLVKSPSATTPIDDGSVSALSYLITPTKTLDASGKRVATYGLGIELDLKPGETRQMLHNGAEGGLGNKGQGGGMGAVGRWNNHGEVRMERMREKLERWVELHGGLEKEDLSQADAHTSIYPTPSSSRSSGSTGRRSSIPPIPLLKLPSLGVTSNLLAKATPSKSPASPSSSPAQRRVADQVSAGSSPTKVRGPAVALVSAAAINEGEFTGATASPQSGGLLDGPADIKVDKPKSGKMSLEERRKSMADRIKGRNKATLGQAVHGDYKLSGAVLSGSALQERLQHRATLSRLPSVAEAVWMMFAPPLSSNNSPSGSTGMPSPPPRPRRKAIRMDDCVDTVVKSSKTPISHAEAEKSIDMLTDKFPAFLLKKVVSKVEYIHMPPGAMGVPVPATATVTSSSPSSPLVPLTRSRATTPPPFARVTGPPASPSPSPRAGKELSGPASPGRVRKFGGLREVREKIRRELELVD